MAGAGDHDVFPDAAAREEESIISARGLEAFGRKVTTTASHLMGPLADPTASQTYQNAMTEVQKQLRRPNLQRSMFSMARTTPTDLVRSKLSANEIEKRALSFVSEEMLRSIPKEDTTSYSLFQGFQATFSDFDEAKKPGANLHHSRHSRHRRKPSRGRKLLEDRDAHGTDGGPHSVQRLRKEKASMMHELEMLGIRKNMASSEIREVDNRIANLNGMRRILMDRLANLENEEALMEHEIVEVETRLDHAQELADDESLTINTPPKSENDDEEDETDTPGFMSQSIYEKIPSSNTSTTSSRGRKPRNTRKKSMPILHEHFQPGTMIRSMRAHQDLITALDFDVPFGMMVSAAQDDTVRVWDLNAGRCIGTLEGHTASVRALQIEDNILATGSRDATIRLWDLNKARYDPSGSHFSKEHGEEDDDEAAMAFENPEDHAVDPPAGTMADCPIFTLEAHVDEITALHFRGDVLVSGSADKTLRHWDLEKGRCVQTLDVMWAAAQASALNSDAADVSGGRWRQTGPSGARTAPPNSSDSTNHSAAADFVGSLQVFESALACGTADGMVRLWDLRSGQVHRSLVGHTGPVTCLQFDDVHLVTGSLDRSVRIWDLRMGSISDAYAYDHPITSMMFDARRIVCAAGEGVAKVYDKVEGRHWDCGAGAADEAGVKSPSVVERVRIKDGYLLEGRRDGVVSAWTC